MPISAGGLGLRDFEVTAPAAYLAAWLDSLPRVAAVAGYISIEDLVRAIDSGSIEKAGGLVQNAVKAASKASVPHCLASGKLAPLFKAQAEVLESREGRNFVRRNGTFMWQKFLCRDLVSGLVAEFRVSVPREQEVWRQRAAAPGAGPFSWLLPSARADDVSAFLETPLFRSAVRDRLFLPQAKVPREAKCQHVRRSGEGERSICGVNLDPHLHHACVCHIGGLVNARHDLVVGSIANDLSALGLRCDQEVWVPQWGRVKFVKGREVSESARLDIRVLEPKGSVWFLDLRVFHPCGERGQFTDRSKPEHHERQKHLRYPTQGEHGQRLHSFGFAPVVFSDLGGLASEGWARLQSLVKCAPKKALVGLSAGEIVRSAALRVVRQTALLKRESLTGIGRGAVRAPEGEPGLTRVESEEADFSLQSVHARQAPTFAQDFSPSMPEVLQLSPESRTVSRPGMHVRGAQSGSIEETRARVLNAMSHSAVFQASSRGGGGPGSALRWNQLPGVSGWIPQGTNDRALNGS